MANVQLSVRPWIRLASVLFAAWTVSLAVLYPFATAYLCLGSGLAVGFLNSTPRAMVGKDGIKAGFGLNQVGPMSAMLFLIGIHWIDPVYWFAIAYATSVLVGFQIAAHRGKYRVIAAG